MLRMTLDIQRTWFMAKFHEHLCSWKILKLTYEGITPKNGRRKLELLGLLTLTSIFLTLIHEYIQGKGISTPNYFCYPTCRHSFITPLKPNHPLLWNDQRFSPIQVSSLLESLILKQQNTFFCFPPIFLFMT